MGIYLVPKYDLTFKVVFAEHPDLVKCFLNALLPFNDGSKLLLLWKNHRCKSCNCRLRRYVI